MYGIPVILKNRAARRKRAEYNTELSRLQNREYDLSLSHKIEASKRIAELKQLIKDLQGKHK